MLDEDRQIAVKHRHQQVHQVLDLWAATMPVLGAKDIGADIGHATLDGGKGNIA